MTTTTEATTALVKPTQILPQTTTVPEEQASLFFNPSLFEHAQRIAKMLATSTLIPDHFRENIGNILIALNFAHRNQIDPFIAMQKLYVIKGKPGIEAQLKIALFQSNSKKYGTLHYKFEGENMTRQCTAYAKDRQTDMDVFGPTISIALARQEGWYEKSGSKWKTMPDKMLMYRAASWFIDTYDPGVVMGLATADEIIEAETFQLPDTTAANSKPLEIPTTNVPEATTVEKKQPTSATSSPKSATPSPTPATSSKSARGNSPADGDDLPSFFHNAD